MRSGPQRLLRRLACAGTLAALVPAALAPATAQNLLPETFEIGLSTERIGITSDFNGARLVIFGALDNADAQILRQQRYDIIVALEGPKRPVVVREKERTLGLWINRGSEDFNAAPSSYALASTRPLGDIAPESTLAQLSIGIDDLRLDAKRQGETAVPNRDIYATAFRRIKKETGLYNQTHGTVEFVSPTLFRADLQLPADLPVGRHVARAFLFRSGVFLRERSDELYVVKTGFENFVYDFATRNSLTYGIFAVLLAIFTGWFGRIVFRRD
ncbi:TIGR02186 family protein [Mangrovicella endophytica]|uniref:TIGR02186 family protein n=1 Tax=Mangrovicella endophytica TaxID=2066697 RepID=UPI000C9E5229|nr:TIGR02186 family protein [Mangrovicella endophytica]